MANPGTISHELLEQLAEAGAVRGAVVVGQAGGWGVVIQYGMTEKVLTAKRGATRVFRKFETLVGYLRDIGITNYQVNAANFDPVAHKVERKRKDAAERLKAVHEAAAYNDWLEKEIQDAIDDPRPSIPHDRIVANWNLRRAELLEQAKKQGEN
ncbi:MAG: antitoxin PaaA2 family protein [Methylobacter sp.]